LKKSNIIFFLLAIVFTGLFSLNSCRKDDRFTSEPVSLRFSTDTVFFDTIFTRLDTANPNFPASVTLQLRVTNPGAFAVKTNISLAGNIYGVYKLNVDGKSGTNFRDVEIRGKDSIFVFVQAYINKVGSNLPFIVNDQLLFETNGKTQSIELLAYGQDAHYLRDSVLALGNIFWPSDKPYVIYNSILVPEGTVLTIQDGARIHSHTKSTIFVQGTLIVNGKPDNEPELSSKRVIFQGDRLDDSYKDVPGQWIGIRILPGSINNQIKGALIKNGFVGIEVDSFPFNSGYGLDLQQSIIKNMSAVGLLNYTSKIKAENNLITNCGMFNFVGELGGTYDLFNNTFAAFTSFGTRRDPGFYLSNAPGKDSVGNVVFKFPLNFNLTNNIIFGTLEDEIYINKDPQGIPITPQIVRNNLIRTTLTADFGNSNNILNQDPQFKDLQKPDFDLKGNSPCKNNGLNVGIFRDIFDRPRNASAPTIGAYEPD